jgi:hypothetical protein
VTASSSEDEEDHFIKGSQEIIDIEKNQPKHKKHLEIRDSFDLTK